MGEGLKPQPNDPFIQTPNARTDCYWTVIGWIGGGLPRFGHRGYMRPIPAVWIGARAEEYIKEPENDAAEFRASSLQKQVMYFVGTARFVILEITQHAIYLVLVNAASLQVRSRITQWAMRCTLVRTETASDAVFDVRVVSRVSGSGYGLRWVCENVVDHFRLLRIIRDWLSRI